MSSMLWGACATLSWIAGLFFWKFYRASRDRLFASFAVAFWVLGAHWVALGFVSPSEETRFYFYTPRLLAFSLIAAAIVDKNRAWFTRARPRP